MLLALALLGAAFLAAGCGSTSSERTFDTQTDSGATAAEPPSSPSKPPPITVGGKACGAIGVRAAALRVTGVNCAAGRKVAIAWLDAENCTIPDGASRSSCRVLGRTCLGTVGDAFVQVNCALPGKSISFVVRPSPRRAG